MCLVHAENDVRHCTNAICRPQHGRRVCIHSDMTSSGHADPMDARTTSLTALSLTSYRLAATACRQRYCKQFIVAASRRYGSISPLSWQPIAPRLLFARCYLQEYDISASSYYSPCFDKPSQNDVTFTFLASNSFRRLFEHTFYHAAHLAYARHPELDSLCRSACCSAHCIRIVLS